jgi:chromosome segregation ATPase
MSNYENVVEELESQISEAETNAEQASSYSDDAARSARDAESQADECVGRLGEMQTAVETLGDECGQLVERVNELETERDALRNESKLQTVVSELEKKLEFERARFQRVVSFIEAIAGESIVIDSTPPGES